MDKILIVDDETSILKLLQRVLEQEGYHVVTADTYDNAILQLSQDNFDLALTDLKMPHTNGIELLRKVKELYPQTEVIIMTGQATVETAIEAIKGGAYDYILKPFNINELNTTVKKCLEYTHLRRRENVFRETTHLYQLAQEITKTHSDKELLNFILERAVRTLHADAGSIFLLMPGKNDLAPMALYGKTETPENEVKFGEKVVGWVAKTRQPVLIQDGFAGLPQFKDLPPRTDILSSMVAPLINQGTLLGVICLNRFVNVTNYQFSQHDMESYKVFVLHATLIITAIQHRESQRQLDELKTEFMANVSHELRTPLMAIGGAVELLHPHIEQIENNEKSKMFLDLIKRNADRMQFLVNDLLDFSRIETDRLRITPSVFPLKRLCEELLQDYHLKVQEKKITLTFTCLDENMEIHADRERIKQVLANLLGNSIKFTPEGGAISIECAKHDNDSLVITISDSGIGIPVEQQDRIFEKFFQVDGSVTRKHAGFGLGLAIVKSIIDKHAGTIKVESEPGKGACFIISLPLRFKGEKVSH